MKLEKLEEKLAVNLRRALKKFNMLSHRDRVMVCLSGGKDSFTLLHLLQQHQSRQRRPFTLHAYTLDQSQPGWDDSRLREWLNDRNIEFTIEKRDTYSVVKEKIPEGKTYCSLCSRLRRGNIYRFAEEHGYTKIALGHHRDDLLESLLMAIFYNGEIRSMPPKLLSDDKKHVVIRPLVYCQEKDIAAFAAQQAFPIIPCNLCGSQKNLTRVKIKRLLRDLCEDNPKVASNMLHALSNVRPSQLMDDKLWDFAALEPALTDVTTPPLTEMTEPS